MKLLIAIVSCHRFRDRANVLRRTWIPDVHPAYGELTVDVRFFVGQGGMDGIPDDETRLDVGDDYKSLRLKTQLMFRWAVEHGYDYIFKTDDDVYVIPERLIRDFKSWDYSGRVRPASNENDAPRIYGASETAFCSGFGYWVSNKAAQIVSEAPDNSDWAEDRFAGNAILRAGLKPHHDPNFNLWPPLMGHACSAPMGRCGQCLLVYKDSSVLCPYARPNILMTLHEEFKRSGNFPTVIR